MRWSRAARSALAWQAFPIAGLVVARFHPTTMRTLQLWVLALVLVPIGAAWTHRSWRVLGAAAALPAAVVGVDVFYGVVRLAVVTRAGR